MLFQKTLLVMMADGATSLAEMTVVVLQDAVVEGGEEPSVEQLPDTRTETRVAYATWVGCAVAKFAWFAKAMGKNSKAIAKNFGFFDELIQEFQIASFLIL